MGESKDECGAESNERSENLIWTRAAQLEEIDTWDIENVQFSVKKLNRT